MHLFRGITHQAPRCCRHTQISCCYPPVAQRSADDRRAVRGCTNHPETLACSISSSNMINYHRLNVRAALFVVDVYIFPLEVDLLPWKLAGCEFSESSALKEKVRTSEESFTHHWVFISKRGKLCTLIHHLRTTADFFIFFTLLYSTILCFLFIVPCSYTIVFVSVA